MNKAIFVDKDGTLLVDVPYNVDPSRMEFYEGARESLRQLQEHGFLIIVVTNQSGVARGFFTEEAVINVGNVVATELANYCVTLDGFYFCPHHPAGSVAAYARPCNCRKPAPGMLLRAAEDFNIDLQNSWMIGNSLDDVAAGRRAGCFTLLISDTETTRDRAGSIPPTATATSLSEAAAIVLENQRVLV
ncbi:HAD family hydrolase [Chryseolinea sp. Jin1]|uniref:D,D-heptose 1,7-bisphosphate phosphatase n=1 Tax=Chryseolinea lacunae TaxID=2801331 RepID=A0ABS1KPY3_9BACT|nr:HAD family hydrolase [Chryseolinea lacunae]